jgi:WD40 repeat protein
VFDVYTGEQRVILAEHTDRVLSACFLHDSSGIATACTDGVLRVYPWPPREGEKVLAPKLSVRMRDSYPAQVVSAPDGKSVYMANDNGTIKKLDTATGLELQSLQVDQQLWKICLSQDGKHLFTTARWSMRMLDLERLEGGGEVTDWTDMETTPAEALPIHIATIVNTRDQTWKADSMWRTTTGLSLVKVKDRQFFAESAYTVYSPDRTQCIKINPTTLYANVRSTKDNKLIRRIGRHAVLAACFSPDGMLAAIGNMTSGTVVYDTKTWKQQYTLKRGMNGPGAILFSPDSSTLAEGNVDGSLRLFDSRTGSLIKELVKPGRSAVLSLDFSKDGGLLAAGLEVDRAIVLNLQTGEQVSTMTGHVRYVHAVKFAPRGDRLATLSRDGTAKLWDVESGRELVTLYSLPQGVVPLGIVFSSNGRFIAAATSDKKVIVTDVFPWNAKTYGEGPEGMDDRVELWKRRTRMNPNITMDDVLPPKS